ncbi:NADAR family protein [Leeia aquatica]|uniref:NADAR family protein n=1 Tax=Leeia aquatica TaxID=2725557 RepID=A0A847SF45_9NEIS|nr:NADAR family protein [Leeia aquatica]NLR74572.1 NADAR family protein [Leeia aquatica]
MEVKTKTMLLFWQADSIFSNWYQPSVFELHGQTFRNGEAGMMYQKARLFGDQAIMQRILDNQDPRTVRDLGRKVEGFDERVWTAQREQLVFEVCLAKFRSNPQLQVEMLASGDRQLVEASPYDRIWGIGLAPDNPLAQQPRHWRGLNLLGQTLMRVRDVLRVED